MLTGFIIGGINSAVTIMAVPTGLGWEVYPCDHRNKFRRYNSGRPMGLGCEGLGLDVVRINSAVTIVVVPIGLGCEESGLGIRK